MSQIVIFAPVSIGELLDKISILEIKKQRIADAGKLANICHELDSLLALRPAAVVDNKEIASHEAQLRAANEELWDLEDRIRDQEKAGEFGAEFIEIARLIYRTNDKRAHAKKMINTICGSEIVEEKSYQSY